MTQAQVNQFASTMVAVWTILMFCVVLFYCCARLLNVLLSDEFFPFDGHKRPRKWLVFGLNLFGALLALTLFLINLGLVVFLGVTLR